MTSLIAALIAAYKANATLMALTPGSIAQGIARKPDFDYVVIDAKPGAVIPTYSDKPVGDITVTFALWSNQGGAVAASTANAIIDYFRSYMPTLTRGSVTNVWLELPPIVVPQMRRDATGKSVVNINIVFKYSGVLY